jgi:hypothetical protein
MQLYWKQMQIQNIEENTRLTFFFKVIVILIVTAANQKKTQKFHFDPNTSLNLILLKRLEIYM